MGPLLVALAALLVIAPPASAQLSIASVRTFGAVSSDADSVRVRVDAPAQPADVGAGEFTIEQWLRCRDEDNLPPVASEARAGDGETATFDWIYGRIFLDRDIDGPPPAGGGDWGASLHPVAGDSARSVVRFGGERSGAILTIQGSTDVCDDGWHHVAVGRDAGGRLFVYVDGVEDYRSQATITGDLRYPNGSGSGQDPFLVWGNEKHGYWGGYRGYLDELRVWDVARTAVQVRDARFTALPGSTPHLELYLRLEEGSGQTLSDATGKNAGAALHDGVAGNGAWTASVPGDGGTPSTSTSSTSSTSTTGPQPTTSSSTTSSTSSTAAPSLTSTTSTAPSTSVTSSSATSTSTTSSTPSTVPPTSSSSTTRPAPSASTTSTTSLLPEAASTTSTVPSGCTSAAGCDDLNPCTVDACLSNTCIHEPPTGFAGALCELRPLVGAPLCPPFPPPSRVERVIAHRIARAARILEAARELGPERRRRRRRIAAAEAQLRRADRRIRSALRKDRLASECGASLLAALDRSRSALAAADPVGGASTSRNAS